MNDELLRLAERCEAATGPDRELDALIHIAVHFPTWHMQTDCEPFPDEVQSGRIQEPDGFGWREAPRFTASLDAAVSLAPNGLVWSLNTFGNPPKASGYVMNERGEQWRCNDYPATPALALCAAALRARAATETPTPHLTPSKESDNA